MATEARPQTGRSTAPPESRGSSGRVPPHNLEAEESVLGAVMLSSDAANAVMDKLNPEDFYVPAHQAIFESITQLYNGNQPIDVVTVSDLLRRSEELDRVGGVMYLTELMERVPTASNVDYYSNIVEEHAMRRNLLQAGARITDFALQTDQEIIDVLDKAEQTVLGVAERRVGDGLQPIAPMLQSTLEVIEELEATGDSITGLATGYRDLDAKLAGLHPANLLIVAARPSMGKSTLALNIASNVAMDGGTVAVFSLEMSKEEIIQRMLCSVGRVDSMALRTGQLDARGWQRVVNAASKMYPAPVYVDDSASVTVTDIRAKSRRLKRQHGLSLIVVDYLQLMQGRNRENRQQEIAEISRNLKNLARELDVPIIAASQLNRGLEAREDKRPRLGDLRECLTADTQIRRSDNGGTISIGEVARQRMRNLPVWSVDSQLELVPAVMTEAWSTGEKPVFRVTTRSGREVRATGNHPFLTFEGWMPLAALESGSRIAVPRRLDSPSEQSSWTDDEVILLAHLIGDGSYLRRQPLRYASGDLENINLVKAAAERRFNVDPIVDQLPDGSYSLRLRATTALGHGRRNPICEWLDDLGVFDQRSHQKRVPQRLFNATDEQLRLFLHHLWATDGSITVRPDDSRGRIYYGSSSRRLAEDVYALLLRLGFQPRLTSSSQGPYRPMWNVDVSGSDQQKKFLNDVSAFGKRGLIGHRLAEVLRWRIANTNVDTIPREFWSQAKTSMAAQGVTHRELHARLNSSYGGSAMFKVAPSRRRAGLVGTVLQDVDQARHAATDVLWDEIKSIEPDGIEETFDARVESTHNFVADEILVHNSGAIEQDADIVLFIYRHEYYYPDDPESKGLAEIIVSKHRAGATGKVDMTFLPRYTLFADVGRDVGP